LERLRVGVGVGSAGRNTAPWSKAYFCWIQTVWRKSVDKRQSEFPIFNSLRHGAGCGDGFQSNIYFGLPQGRTHKQGVDFVPVHNDTLFLPFSLFPSFLRVILFVIHRPSLVLRSLIRYQFHFKFDVLQFSVAHSTYPIDRAQVHAHHPTFPCLTRLCFLAVASFGRYSIAR